MWVTAPPRSSAMSGTGRGRNTSLAAGSLVWSYLATRPSWPWLPIPQVSTSPLAVSATAWREPAAIWRTCWLALVSGVRVLCSFTLSEKPVRLPPPSSLNMPHPYTVLSEARANVKPSPAAICTNLTPSGAAARPGSAASSFSSSGVPSHAVPPVLRPSAPSSFTPQVHTWPSDVRATVCMPPHATCTKSLSGTLMWAGLYLTVWSSPRPRAPNGLLPNTNRSDGGSSGAGSPSAAAAAAAALPFLGSTRLRLPARASAAGASASASAAAAPLSPAPASSSSSTCLRERLGAALGLVSLGLASLASLAAGFARGLAVALALATGSSFSSFSSLAAALPRGLAAAFFSGSAAAALGAALAPRLGASFSSGSCSASVLAPALLRPLAGDLGASCCSAAFFSAAALPCPLAGGFSAAAAAAAGFLAAAALAGDLGSGSACFLSLASSLAADSFSFLDVSAAAADLDARFGASTALAAAALAGLLAGDLALAAAALAGGLSGLVGFAFSAADLVVRACLALGLVTCFSSSSSSLCCSCSSSRARFLPRAAGSFAAFAGAALLLRAALDDGPASCSSASSSFSASFTAALSPRVLVVLVALGLGSSLAGGCFSSSASGLDAAALPLAPLTPLPLPFGAAAASSTAFVSSSAGSSAFSLADAPVCFGSWSAAAPAFALPDFLAGFSSAAGASASSFFCFFDCLPLGLWDGSPSSFTGCSSCPRSAFLPRPDLAACLASAGAASATPLPGFTSGSASASAGCLPLLVLLAFWVSESAGLA
mmetsp:Transcript_39408/g.87687  ORF Transcript_39408/g.87687 Transcript_39408/m.87687 type:complete len:773 (-) Transcript_39408:32-2350(-)